MLPLSLRVIDTARRQCFYSSADSELSRYTTGGVHRPRFVSDHFFRAVNISVKLPTQVGEVRGGYAPIYQNVHFFQTRVSETATIETDCHDVLLFDRMLNDQRNFLHSSSRCCVHKKVNDMPSSANNDFLGTESILYKRWQ